MTNRVDRFLTMSRIRLTASVETLPWQTTFVLRVLEILDGAMSARSYERQELESPKKVKLLNTISSRCVLKTWLKLAVSMSPVKKKIHSIFMNTLTMYFLILLVSFNS
jgi:hypothetical protein